ncbi:MAG: F0F1 ATP synthase subunit A [Calditrichia bacterium]|nr:F0F1 ATP synthase subunit A [Calditrichia bacterium]
MAILAALSTYYDSGTQEGQEENVGEFIVHHVTNSNEWNLFGYHLQLPQFEPITVLGMQIDLSITNHVVMIWIAALFLLLTFGISFRKRSLVPRGFATILEMLIIFIRDEIAIPNLGEEDGRKFTPLICTFFFFILTCNLMGLIPLFTTPTGNINITAAMALITLGTGQVFGIIRHGFFGHFKGLVPSGVPLALIPLMFVIELMGLMAKHFALLMRLFANMVAGHIVIFAFLAVIIIFKSFLAAPFSIGFAIFVNFLEILIGFIQAYVFTMLSTLFIGMSLHPEH